MPYDLQPIQTVPTGAGNVFSPGNLASPSVIFPSTFPCFLMSFWICANDDVTIDAGAFHNVPAPPNETDYGVFLFLNFSNDASTSTMVIGDGALVASNSNRIIFNTTLQPTTLSAWNVLVSVDSATSTGQLYINDTAATVQSQTWSGGNPIASFSGNLGLQISAGAASGANPTVGLGDFYCGSTSTFFDLSDAANRHKFHDISGNPVDLGSDASSVTGTAPEIYLSIRSGGTAPDFLTNLGSSGGTMSSSNTPISGHCSELPLPPTPFCGGTHTTTSFTAAWTPNPFGGTPTGYEVQYRQEGTMDWTTIPSIMAESILITGLQPATVYEFQVLAGNDDGSSDFSASEFCGTDGNVIPVQPVPNSLFRWRGQVGVNWKGMALVGDAFDNVVGLSDFANFTEYGNTMQFLITTPPLHEDRKRIFVPRFEIEVEAGDGLPDTPAIGGTILLDWSKDGGITWSTLVQPRSMGAIGEYIKRLRWLNLGNSRTWIFRLRCSDPIRRYIIGTYLDQWKGLG